VQKAFEHATFVVIADHDNPLVYFFDRHLPRRYIHSDRIFENLPRQCGD
jgi:hypothetical protein